MLRTDGMGVAPANQRRGPYLSVGRVVGTERTHQKTDKNKGGNQDSVRKVGVPEGESRIHWPIKSVAGARVIAKVNWKHRRNLKLLIGVDPDQSAGRWKGEREKEFQKGIPGRGGARPP